VVGSFVVTAAHVVYPSKVDLQLHDQGPEQTPLVTLIESVVTVGALQGAGGVPAEILHINHRFDLAILSPKTATAFPSVLYPLARTWWDELPGASSSLLQAGACVAVMVPRRDDLQTPLPWYEIRMGKVIAPYTVSDAPRVVAAMNPNTVTISTPLLPGDSGSPSSPLRKASRSL
jgi:hypothetical protein